MFKNLIKLKLQTLSLLSKANLWTANNNKILNKVVNKANFTNQPSPLHVNPETHGKF